MVKEDILALFLTLGEAIGCLTIKYDAHYQFEEFSSIPSLLKVFISNRCWILANDFSASIEMIIWLLILWITLIDFQSVN